LKYKKKGFQQSAIGSESLETSDFRPFEAYYLSLRDIKQTVSTCLERSKKMPLEAGTPLEASYISEISRLGKVIFSSIWCLILRYSSK